MHIESIGIRISYSKAEHLRKWLSSHNAINQSLSFIKEENSLIIPLNLSEEEASNLLLTYSEDMQFIIGISQFEEKDYHPKNLFEAVQKVIPLNQHKYIPKAYDMIGDIVIVDIPEEISEHNSTIGSALLDLFPSIISVYRKASSVSGEYRTRELELIAGEEKCETVHLEYGIRISVDVCETYFSPRLGEEHKRVADSVKQNECIIDLFTGVGSFPLHIAKNLESVVYAIDINKNAIECLEKSIPMNKLRGTIHPIHGDCREVVKSIPRANRVIMNLPSKSLEFVDIVCDILKPNGILYFYYFTSEKSAKEDMIKELNKKLTKSGWKIKKTLDFRKVRDSAPREIQACLQVSIVPLSEL
ncbi:MAG: class I SAM-dependent methyltransferase family protein [Candidatus Heimdallarchaeota archaeon]|nr:class I SAM-dependent methyltransferase family protein [Candidatus Heimdallarchaeota archaeon]MCK4769815.1 class I SAM-dependent methyltransferase family protein [Candidatus Heimdallarchaeota archaeon]